MNEVEAISARGLTKKFGDLTAVDRLDLSARQGEILGLIGPDGAGKTTTMRMLAGAITIDEGTAEIMGESIVEATEKARANIGYMPQRFSLYGDLTVDENMKFFADLYGVRGDEYRRRRDELMQFSRLGPHHNKFAGSLSGGMQKKLALSCNLIHRPPILLLDEPTNGVDPVSRRELWGLLYDLLAGGTTIIVSTPYMDEAERCSRVALLYEGRLLVCDRPDQISRMIDGQILEVDVDDKRRGLDIFGGLEGVHDAYPYHSRLHLLFADGDAGITQIKAAAAEHRLTIKSIMKKSPGFGDVFINLIEKTEKENASN